MSNTAFRHRFRRTCLLDLLNWRWWWNRTVLLLMRRTRQARNGRLRSLANGLTNSLTSDKISIRYPMGSQSMARGEIYLAMFPFGDVPGMKLRPVLTLTDAIGPVPEVVVAYISSVIPANALP